MLCDCGSLWSSCLLFFKSIKRALIGGYQIQNDIKTSTNSLSSNRGTNFLALIKNVSYLSHVSNVKITELEIWEMQLIFVETHRSNLPTWCSFLLLMPRYCQWTHRSLKSEGSVYYWTDENVVIAFVIVNFNVIANGADPDQTPRSATSVLGLHCLHRAIVLWRNAL